jgi:hypothetical protein
MATVSSAAFLTMDTGGETTSHWYDPSSLDAYLQQFEEGDAVKFDDDEFSLPSQDEASVEEENSNNVEGDAERARVVKSEDSNKQQQQRAVQKSVDLEGLKSKMEATARKESTSNVETMTHRPPENSPTSGSKKKLLIPSGGSSGSKKHIAGFSTVGKPVKCADSPASGVEVRKKNYKKNGQKSPSGPSLYEFAAIDVLKGKKKISKVYQSVTFPWAGEVKSMHGLPATLVVVLQLPNKGPQMFRSAGDTDPGIALVLYFKLRPTCPQDEAANLAARFFNGSATGRFKTIPFVDNLSELKFPSFLSSTLSKFNGKPVVISKTGAFFNEKDVSEVDVDIFQFPVIARTALSTAKSSTSLGKIRIAFVLQGDADDELPERLLACVELRNLDLDGCAYDRFS